MTEHVAKLYRSIYAVVRRIPTGQVATYGQVAELAGIPGGARIAAAALKMVRPGERLPWQRVIGKAGKNRGRIAIHNPVGAAIQRQLLDDEGVTFSDVGLISLDRYGWLPSLSIRRVPAGRSRSDRRPAPSGRRSSRSSAHK
ncbi:MAG TPA: MGMT family protein [Kofleriaceae bacterium]|nr:MGMT family protein [Kofleriaceae bacterium]